MLTIFLYYFLFEYGINASKLLLPEYYLPQGRDVLEVISEAPEKPMPAEFDILVWNVYKGTEGNRWAQDFRTLAQGKELVLLQEAMLDSFMPGVLQQETDKGFVFAKSFADERGNYTGVTTGQAQQPTGYIYRRSPGTEPVTNTPKMALLSKYKISENHRLLVINIHSLNFVDNAAHLKQIQDILPFIEHHDGPVVFAGDFNTWNAPRDFFLRRSLEKYGLKRIKLANDIRNIPLDHIFVRGCTAKSAEVRADISSSDHYPLTARLSCPK